MSRTITEEEMINSESFCFGKGFLLSRKKIYWNPDTKGTHNAHIMITGGSGSGKTRLLKKIIAYLKNRNKQVYIIDFHGDISIPGEFVFKFTTRNSKFGLNPFEFDKDRKNGGVEAQVNIIVSLFKKNFLPNIGALQKNVLKRLLSDTYKYVGIVDEDETTWNKPIPSISTLYDLYIKIQNKIKTLYAEDFIALYGKIGKAKMELDRAIESSFEEDMLRISKRIDSLLEKLEEKQSRYYDFIKTGSYADEFELNIGDIDVSFYLDESIIKVFKSLYPYISDLYSSSVFNDNKPPKAKGVVRYDISGFTNIDKPLEAMFFADVMIQKIFRAYKFRGEYRLLPQQHKEKRGYKADAFIVIDESKLVLPTGREKENPYNILNRIVTEARKFGLGLIVVSQRIDHFPQEMISSIFTKVVLKINENDVSAAQKLLGVRNKELFEHLKTDGVALVGTSGGDFTSVALPWVKLGLK